MGIYLPNMEIPICCFECPFMLHRSFCLVNTKIEFTDEEYSELKGRYIGCPLIPVPPHGRLIDADALAAQCDNPYLCVWLSDVENALTIIPAEPITAGEEKNDK